MDEINEMQDLIEKLRALLDDFDLDVHNDEANANHIDGATTALETLSGCVEDLVP